ncbi:hypothetical protein CBS147346_9769 [Aspergillus niger]|nr:hypothetical protein CBS147346_9769 [Aspergillus niger]
MSNPRPNPNPKKEKRPPLTHFLCLPLINATSLPQLESSLATFKASVPTFQPPQDQHQHHHEHHQHQPQPLIPPSAHRPVGTLHLTLGVMSLPTPDRLSQAIRFLHSLDLEAMLRETPQSEAASSAAAAPEAIASPFLISLESLHAIPRAKAATVLHAAPVDPTNRLYPFCVRLRDRFLEEGFLVGDKPAPAPVPAPVPAEGGGEGSGGVDIGGEEQQRQMDLAEDSAREGWMMVPAPTSATAAAPVESKPKVRPLLLHATIVNTIYAKWKGGGHGGRGGRGGRGGNGKGDKRKRQYTFDAREILARYRDYTSAGESVESTETVPNAAVPDNEGSGSEGEGSLSKRKGTPFVWARDFPIESVCICEMGAKKLVPDLNGKDEGMNARLGEKYRVVAEKSLLFGL